MYKMKKLEKKFEGNFQDKFMKNYLEFIKEEVIISFFPYFREFLKQMMDGSDESLVVKWLLELEGKDLDVNFNLFSISSEKNDEVLFRTVSKTVTEWQFETTAKFISSFTIKKLIQSHFPNPDRSIWMEDCNKCVEERFGDRVSLRSLFPDFVWNQYRIFSQIPDSLFISSAKNIKVLKVYTLDELRMLGRELTPLNMRIALGFEYYCPHGTYYNARGWRVDEEFIRRKMEWNLDTFGSVKQIAVVQFELGGYKLLNIINYKSLEQKVISGGNQNIKIGRLVQKFSEQTGRKFSKVEIENFVNKFKSTWESIANIQTRIRIVEGEDIRKYYSGKNYVSYVKSTLQKSCMRYQRCQKYFDIYVDNPRVCKMIILDSEKEPGKIEARALLWTLMNGKKFMDRIYYSSQFQYDIFVDLAKKNNWIWKDNKHFIRLGDNRYSEDLTVELDNLYGRDQMDLLIRGDLAGPEVSPIYLPYFDTLNCLDLDKLVLHNGSEDYATDYELDDNYGGIYLDEEEDEEDE